MTKKTNEHVPMACKNPTKTRIDCIQLDPLWGSNIGIFGTRREPMGSEPIVIPMDLWNKCN